ncbi:hypothetical protein PGB26_07075 [Microbacterium sp. nov. GSS16]|nr:hypothetical protein [Microbacterium sp. nov. GSS16]WCD91470.1 hypothetical protein PGB26_07075 [Microbacterium sp. nov. GSS16]
MRRGTCGSGAKVGQRQPPPSLLCRQLSSSTLSASPAADERLDAADRAAAASAETYAAEKAALEAEVEVARSQLGHAVAKLEAKRHENAELDKQIIEERSAAQALRTTINAPIANIPS